jgi:hypothetical protein
MDEDESPRELLHELGNVQQEKVALQYLLCLAADEIERLAESVADPDDKVRALQAAERFRRSAEL